MKTWLFRGAVLLDAASIVIGLFLLFWGGMVAVFGGGPDGPIRAFAPHLAGAAGFFAGVLNVFPVSVVRRRNLLVGYGCGAVALGLIFDVCRWADVFDPSKGEDYAECAAALLLLAGVPVLKMAVGWWRLTLEAVSGRPAPGPRP